VRPGRDHAVPALAAVMCAELGLATPIGRRGALGSRGTRLPQNRALCRDVRVPQWMTAQNRAPGRDVRGGPPGGAPRESGSPATHPIGQPGLSPGRGERGSQLPRGGVSERQTGHRLTNSGWRSSTCRRGARGPSPLLPPPAVRAADMARAWRRPAGARWWSLPAPGCGGAPAPSPRSALQPALGRGDT
jgi:hypothetical protein